MAGRLAVACWFVVSGAACTDAGRGLSTGFGEVEVRQVEVGPPAPLPAPPVSPGPLGMVMPPGPQLVYAEPLPLPVRHAPRVALLPVGALALHDVQAVEVTVEVSGGAVGAREVSALFVSPQGLAWERQARRVELAPGATVSVRFSLPVAATLVEDHGLSGRWTVTTLDDGVEQASTGFEVAP